MSTKRSDLAYAAWRKAAQRFDYFVTGVAVALVAYLGPSIDSVRIGINVASLEVSAVVLFLASALAGFKRIETNVTIFGASQRRLYKEESAGTLSRAAMQGRVLHNKATGELFSAARALEKSTGQKAAAKWIMKEIQRLTEKSEFWYRWRNRLLYVGLLLLIAARVLPAYVSP